MSQAPRWRRFGAVTGRQRPGWLGRWLGALSAAFDQRRRHVDGPRDLCGSRLGRVVDPGCDQHDHHLPEHARAGDDPVQSAAVFMVDLCHRLADPAVPARSGGCDHHAADRPELSAPRSSSPKAAAIRSSISTSCGSLATRKSTSLSCPASVSSATWLPRSPASRSSAICRWSGR